VTRELRDCTGWVVQQVDDDFFTVNIYGTEFIMAASDLWPPLVELRGPVPRAIVSIPPAGMTYTSADGETWVFTGKHKVVSCAWAYQVRRNNRLAWVYLRDFQRDVARKDAARKVEVARGAR